MQKVAGSSPVAPISFTYGNLTQSLSLSCGTIAPGGNRSQVYAWDAENRLKSVEPVTPTSGDQKIEFAYDYLGRRVEAVVSTRGASSWSVSETRRYVWYNWLMLIETQGTASTPVIRRKFTWGLDLAGQSGQVNSMESAGGIGGLLGVLDTLGDTTAGNDLKYTYFYDGNGNVTQLVDRTESTLANALKANYEYDAYGNTTYEGGSYAAVNRFRFSTKVFDAETTMGYWGYRYYLPWIGRWTNRDPIGVSGGINPYAAFSNSPHESVDPIGLQSSQASSRPCRRCCCIDPIPRITNVKTVGTDGAIEEYGHEFTLEFRMTFKQAPKDAVADSDCTFEWFEWSNVDNTEPAPRLPKIRDWNNMSNVATGVFREWPGHKEYAPPTCFGEHVIRSTDRPTITISRVGNTKVTRDVYIFAQAKSSPNCSCASRNAIYRIYQRTKFDGYPVDRLIETDILKGKWPKSSEGIEVHDPVAP